MSNQSADVPLGVGGKALHDWHVGDTKDHRANRQVISDMMDRIGATIMGRNVFGPVRGAWRDSDYGGTTFHFVTDGIEPRTPRLELVRVLDASGVVHLR